METPRLMITKRNRRGEPPPPYPCPVCGRDVPATRRLRHARTCSEGCTKKDSRARWVALQGRPPLSAQTTGAVAELVVAADLMRRGYEVFRALSPSCSCDLAVLRDGLLVRVEVRTGNRLTSGDVCVPLRERDKGRHDVMAVYVAKDAAIEYSPKGVIE